MGKRLLSQGAFTPRTETVFASSRFTVILNNLTENETLPRTSPAHLMPGTRTEPDAVRPRFLYDFARTTLHLCEGVP